MKNRKYWFCYVIVFLAAAGLRQIYCDADSERLMWLLAPTAWWVRALSGSGFVYEPGIGYVDHELRFIIAPACAGVRFLIICMVMLVCSFAHRLETGKRALGYTICCLGLSWAFTVLVNGLRIVLSIFLPPALEKVHILNVPIDPEQLHTAIGTAVYFLSLTGLYGLADTVLQKKSERSSKRTYDRYVLPVFWYFFMVLGVPLFLRILRHDYADFAEYARYFMRVCLVSLCMLGLLRGMSGLTRKFARLSAGRSARKWPRP